MEACNYVGKLQEICSKKKAPKPEYNEIDYDAKSFKFSCAIGELTTEGIGISKKSAKQRSAQLMIDKIEKEEVDLPTEKTSVQSSNANAVSQLYQYCVKEKKTKPLFSEKGEEQGSVVIECSFEGFVGIGKGLLKKEAKEQAAKQVLKNFGIDSYFKEVNNIECRFNSLKTSVSQLNELCQIRKFKSVIYKEETISLSDNKRLYEFTCTVGDNQVKSSQKLSKKEAKNEAAVLMLNILENQTPVPSPIERPTPSEQNRETTSPATILSPNEKPTPSEQDEEKTSPPMTRSPNGKLTPSEQDEEKTSPPTTRLSSKRATTSEQVNGNVSPAKKPKIVE